VDVKIPLLKLPHSWLPFLRWLLKPILRPICRNLVHGTHPRTTGLAANDEGLIFEDVDWMGVTVYRTMPWEYLPEFDYYVAELRKRKEEVAK
jgi:hypothetical protein